MNVIRWLGIILAAGELETWEGWINQVGIRVHSSLAGGVVNRPTLMQRPSANSSATLAEAGRKCGDADVGLQCHSARWYNSSTGRWTSHE